MSGNQIRGPEALRWTELNYEGDKIRGVTTDGKGFSFPTFNCRDGLATVLADRMLTKPSTYLDFFSRLFPQTLDADFNKKHAKVKMNGDQPDAIIFNICDDCKLTEWCPNYQNYIKS